MGTATAFLIACFIRIGYDIFRRQMMTFSGGAFDNFGTAWIVLKGAYYGLLGLLFWLTITMLIRKSLYGLVFGAIFVLLFFIDCSQTNVLEGSRIDVAIRRVGYLISRVRPYEPADSRLSVIAVLPPRTCIDLMTKQGQLTLCSGNGALRRFLWNGQVRSVDVAPASIQGEPFLVFPKRRTGEHWPGYCWQDNQGIKRCFYSEGWLAFDTAKEFNTWIKTAREYGETLAVSDDGLVISISTIANAEALTAMVWRVSINGQSQFPVDCKLPVCRVRKS